MATLQEEISRRRTFAIISHPDAGKTTLTEKFLLYGGAIAQAGEVKGKRDARGKIRLDGNRKAARHFGHVVSHAVPARAATASTSSTRRAIRTSPRTPTAR